MKHLQNSARTITVFDDEKVFGTVDAEQYPTAPVVTIEDSKIAHPLRGLLNSALNLIATRNETLGEETDSYEDHLIPLFDEEEIEGDRTSFEAAATLLDTIAQSLNSENIEAKSPLLLAAFKSRFLG